MTKLLVLSDSHGGRAAIERVLMKESKSIDALIFLGDGLRDLELALTLYPKLRAYSVAGNCDYGALEPTDGLAAFDFLHPRSYVRCEIRSGYAGRCRICPGCRGGAVRSHPHPPCRDPQQGVFVQPRLLRPVLHRAGHLRHPDAGRRQSDRL